MNDRQNCQNSLVFGKVASLLKVLADQDFNGDNLPYPNFNMVIISEFGCVVTKTMMMAEFTETS